MRSSHPNAMGMSCFHPSDISWSYRNLGSAPRNQMKQKQSAVVFTTNHRIGKSQLSAGMSGCHPSGPPKKSVTMIADIVIVFMNSARKKRAKRIELYSVWYPPTSSDSASTVSNGGRLTSAVIATRKTAKGTMPRRITFQCQIPCAWASTIPVVESVPATRTTVAIASPSAASYEIIWALARTELMSGYLEPDPHPARITP